MFPAQEVSDPETLLAILEVSVQEIPGYRKRVMSDCTIRSKT
jgi:hypothetical protein